MMMTMTDRQGSSRYAAVVQIHFRFGQPGDWLTARSGVRRERRRLLLISAGFVDSKENK